MTKRDRNNNLSFLRWDSHMVSEKSTLIMRTGETLHWAHNYMALLKVRGPGRQNPPFGTIGLVCSDENATSLRHG